MLQKVIDLEKAPRNERELLESLLDKQEPRIRRAFAVFLAATRSDDSLRQVRRLLEVGNIEGALRIVDSHVLAIGVILTTIFQDIGTVEAATLSEQLQGDLSRLAIIFDSTNERAANVMRRSRLKFITDFTRSQREVTRQAIVDTLRAGGGSRAAALAFRDSIGLTLTQRNAVANYQALLENNSREALRRALRDRRFDPTVERAVTTGKPLGSRRINTMVDRYRQRFLSLRAETIARTEGLRAVNQARQEALRQMLEQTDIEPSRVVRIWRATLDARVRDTHAAMNRQERGLNDRFQSPSGARLLFPGDPTAPGHETINCRCVVIHRINPETA